LSPPRAVAPLLTFPSPCFTPPPTACIFSPSVAPPPAPPRAAAPAAELAGAAPQAEAPACLLRALTWPHPWRAGSHPPASDPWRPALPQRLFRLQIERPLLQLRSASPSPACAPRIELPSLWLRSSRAQDAVGGCGWRARARAPRHVRASKPPGSALDLASGRPNGTVASDLQVAGAAEKTAMQVAFGGPFQTPGADSLIRGWNRCTSLFPYMQF
jgi:hypothetical protein